MTHVLTVIGLLLYQFHCSWSVCSPESNGVTVFGPKCGYMCHCVGGVQCDDVTGECPNGCADNWFGPGCQYRNLAIRGFAYHLDDVPDYKRAYNAIDQLFSSCSETNVSEWGENRTVNPFFRIYWEYMEPIRAISITPKDKSLKYFVEGFNITVENVTFSKQANTIYFPTESQTCHTHTANTPLPTTFEIYCDGGYIYGNQIRIQLSDKFTQLSLCEVKVYGGRNVAFKKTTLQKSSSEGYGPELAVDGIRTRDKCTMTNFEYHPWWEVNLGQEHFLQSIDIFKYTDLRLRYYKLYQRMRGSEKWRLFHDDSVRYYPLTYIAKTVNTKIFRLWVENSNFRIRLCEIEIFGDCPDNMCGLDCSTPCHCRQFDHMDVVYGKCERGCAERWTGTNGSCNTECEDDKWGETCEYTCGRCFGDEPCDVRTGWCPSGCVAGFNGSLCIDKCSNGTFGRNCLQDCSKTCGDGCDRRTGVCENGCQPGWRGYFCELECKNGTYGVECNSQCNATCMDGCNHINGSCEGGCVGGLEGEFCDQECLDGFLGPNCQAKCGNCEKQPCNKTNGHCESECLPGYEQDELCQTECSNGTFGQDCGNICNMACFNGCNNINGSCIGGCVSGFDGELCNERCSDGMWGPNCLNKCGNCETQPCNKTTGHCYSICLPGYIQNELCQTECPDQFYGKNCTESCGKCFDQETCQKSDGACLNGCGDGYHGAFCLQRLESAKASLSTTFLGAVIGGAVGLLVITCIVIVIIIKRCRKKADERLHSRNSNDRNDIPLTEKPSSRVTYANIYENTSVLTSSKGTSVEEESDIDHVYYNNDAIVSSGDKEFVNVSNLKEYLMKHSKTSTFEDEFKSIPYGLQRSTNEALRPENVAKNRYKNIYPYDDSRVILKMKPGKPGSDYINASFIDGYHRKNQYIAAQGPTENSICDFWRMVWENDIELIIMVTNPCENSKKKCLEYWNCKPYGDIVVSSAEEETYAEVKKRILNIHCKSKPGSRCVTQMHYTAWPDKSTPQSVASLVDFLYKCKELYNDSGYSALVHCSAGVGRTGTFIALDILHDQGKDQDSIRVLEVVQNLRKQRVNMVQTKGQYVFLHLAAYEALTQPPAVKVGQFEAQYDTLMEIDISTKQPKLMMEYQTIIEEVVPQEYLIKMNGLDSNADEFSEAKKAENKNKNRYSNILAGNSSRPFLSSSIEGCNSYINAAYIQSFMDTNGYLITQSALPGTVLDCCCLVHEFDVTCIVTFDDVLTNEDEKYLPDTGTIERGPFEISMLELDDKEEFIERKYCFRQKEQARDIRHYAYKNWKWSETLPSSSDSFLTLILEVQSFIRKSEGKLLVQCLNGAEKSGIFVVLLHVLERIRHCDDVAIRQIVKMVRQRRQQIIPNFEQYKFCYDIVLHHLREDSTYTNV